MLNQQMAETIERIVIPGRGILAADESTNTIKKRLDSINVVSTEDARRDYRELLFTTPKLGNFISGVILFEETLGQSSKAGESFAALLDKNSIVPGIKVDKGVIPLSSSPDEKITQGLDGLADRLEDYKKQGARFAKWRAVLNISDVFPSQFSMHANAEALARYASICQGCGVVPIVEPELLMDGAHTIERCFDASVATLHTVFEALYKHNVALEYIILKPSMVISGNTCKKQAGVEQVAELTLKCLKRTVPAAVPTINFLSGGQSDVLATQHLNAMHAMGALPWYVSFSYGRALQAPALKAWGGDISNVDAAQAALFKRAQLNGAATLGDYSSDME